MQENELEYGIRREIIYKDKYVKDKKIYNFIKRFMDIFLCLLASIIGIPIVIITCICVVLESKGNPIYKQERMGENGKIFNLYKIRSMYIDAEKESGPKWADKNDDRVTKIGRFIRKTRIDELPQLYNIIKGDMSIVGPRPERPFFTYKFENEIPGFMDRLQVKPGLTGLAQVNGGYDVAPNDKLRWDLKYIKSRSIWVDTKIIVKTVYIIISGDGAR